MTAAATRSVVRIAREVKSLHDQDEQLGQLKQKTEAEQRDIRLKVGRLVKDLGGDERQRIAEVSGYTVGRLRDYALMAVAWPEGTYPDQANYTAMEEIKGHPDRFTWIAENPDASKRDAREWRGGKVDTPSRWAPEVKASFIDEALKDPEVRKRVTDAEMGAQVAADASAYSRLRADGRTSSDGHHAQDVGDVARLWQEARALARKIDSWTEDARALRVSQDDKDYLLGAVEEMVIAVTAAKNHINSTDAAFAALLGEDR